jgi:hypothetical protein
MAATPDDDPGSAAEQAAHLAAAVRALNQCRLRYGLSPFKP